MLDALRRMGGGSKSTQQQVDELQALLRTAREERETLRKLLAQVPLQGATLSDVSKKLEKVKENSGTVSERLEQLTSQTSKLDERIHNVEGIDGRVRTLLDALAKAEQNAEKLMSPDGDLQKHRAELQNLSTQAQQAKANLETIKKDQAGLEEVRGQLRQANVEVKESTDRADLLKNDIEQLRALTVQLNQEYSRLKDTSREIRENANTTVETVKEVEKKLGPLAALQELSKNAEERVATLNALAEHVSQKVRVLENQRHTVERAIVESNRVNEMIWNMDVQIAKLNETTKHATRAEETADRMEKLARDMGGQFDAAMKAKESFAQDVSKLERERAGLAEFVRTHMERLSVEKKEFDAFDQRLRAVQASIAETEKGMEALAAKDRNLSAMNSRIDGLGKQIRDLAAQAEELQKKQTAVESLQERLSEVDALSKKTAWQFESLKKSREELEAMRKEIQELYKAHGAAVQLRDKLAADRVVLEAFLDRAAVFSGRLPEVDAKMESIAGKLSVMEEAAQKATSLVAITDELDRKVVRVVGQQQFVERVEDRVNLLNTLASEVDRKLEEQLARRGEVDTLKSLCDGVAIQVTDVQQKLQTVGDLQNKLMPLATQINMLKGQLEKAHARLREVQKDETQIAEQEKRLRELLAASQTIATDIDERSKHVQGLADELNRSAAIRDEMLEELARVEVRQRDVGVHAESSEEQIKRLETALKQLDHRRSQLAFAEKKIGMFEGRLGELKLMTDEVDRKLKVVNAKDSLVDSVMKEVDGVHEISARSKADLQYVVEHRADVAALKTKVDEALTRIGEVDERIALIEARRRMVDEVHLKTNVIANMIEDVRINLEMLAEQKVVVDHVVEDLSQLDQRVKEAQSTLKALHTERELAERIERSVKLLRAKTTVSDEGAKTA